MERIKNGQSEPVEVFENDIEIYLKLFCEENNIENLRQEPQSVWNGCLMFICRHMFKGTDRLKDHNVYSIENNSISSNFNRYNYELVNDVLDIYIYLCSIYDKEISIMGFSNLTGINQDTIHEWGNGRILGSLSADIYKKLYYFREESLSNKLATGNKNPVGILAILNRHYSWNLPGVSRDSASSSRHALTVDQLPKIGQVAQKQQVKEIEKQNIVIEE